MIDYGQLMVCALVGCFGAALSRNLHATLWAGACAWACARLAGAL